MVDDLDSNNAQRSSQDNKQSNGTNSQSPVESSDSENGTKKRHHYASTAWNKLKAAYKHVVVWFRARDDGFWTALATIVMAITTGIYTYYARKQWKEMSNSTDLLATQTKLLSAQLKGTMSAIVRFEEPRLTPDPITQETIL